MAKASGSSLSLVTGVNVEAGFAEFGESADVAHVGVSDGVGPIDIAADAYAGRPNPHAWMSPLNAQIYVENMVAAFSELDPANAPDFAANGAEYTAELQQIQDELVEIGRAHV